MINLNERMLAFVPRWTIAPRINEQRVAEHSYFVALYAMRLAHHLGLPAEDRLKAIEYALMHDVQEFLFSDIPGPAKQRIVNDEEAERFFNSFVSHDYADHVMDTSDVSPQIKQIVKCADVLDALCWTFIEVQMGNHLLVQRFDVAAARVREALTALDLGYVIAIIEEEFQSARVHGIKLPEYKK